ncbi:hypothetical protein G3I60_15970 [Streptomyces sp. SID13666]|uniref:hypothetical protein n=1 Tax=Streptomyces sp. SID13666 TaxID=2706054 RepID=UPI0013C1043B|nr:hypothetical protein [Streptomyces sp. SID13666]NEA55606.1 hypothetical protein [Streptomyces sp. SID13666]
MAELEVNPSVVALLCDSDFTYRDDTRTWSHSDGRPFSNEEQTTALHANREEFFEFHAQFERYMEYKRGVYDAPEVMNRFLAPFMNQLAKKTLGNAVELMSKDERVEFDRLLALQMEPVRPFTPYTF